MARQGSDDRHLLLLLLLNSTIKFFTGRRRRRLLQGIVRGTLLMKNWKGIQVLIFLLFQFHQHQQECNHLEGDSTSEGLFSSVLFSSIISFRGICCEGEELPSLPLLNLFLCVGSGEVSFVSCYNNISPSTTKLIRSFPLFPSPQIP